VNLVLFTYLIFIFSINAHANSGLVEELKKIEEVEDFNNPKYFNFIYRNIVGSSSPKPFYYDKELYDHSTEAGVMCSYLANMYLFAAMYPGSKYIDLKFLGALDPFEVNRTIFRSINSKGFFSTYENNRKEIQACLKGLFYIREYKGKAYNKSLYDPDNSKNKDLEKLFLIGLTESSQKIGNLNFSLYYRYDGTRGIEAPLFDKSLPQKIYNEISALKNLALKNMSSNGIWEAGVQCVNLTDVSFALENKSRNMTHIECPIRKTISECTDSAYLINKVIVQGKKYFQDHFDLLKIYQIQLYQKDGAKIKLDQTNHKNLNDTLWDYHAVSLLILEDPKTKQAYMVIIDNLINDKLLTISNWLSYFENPTELRFRVFPYIRVEEKEKKYMTMEEAIKYSEKNTIRPASNKY
jgi:hypothetical protein